jgi:hypothetical protein
VRGHHHIRGGDEALQLYDAVTGRAADRVIVIDLSRVSVSVDKGLNMLLFLQRWARHRGIQLELFNPCPSLRRELEHAISPYELEVVSLAGCGKTRLRLIMLSRFGDYVAKGRVLVASAAA